MSSRKSQTQNEFQDIPGAAEHKDHRSTAVRAAIAAMEAAGRRLDEMTPVLEDFVRERDRLGEYDAGAAAIMEMAKINLELAQMLRALTGALMDLETNR